MKKEKLFNYKRSDRVIKLYHSFHK